MDEDCDACEGVHDVLPTCALRDRSACMSIHHLSL